MFPPTNGGQLRCYNLLTELGRAHKVDALTIQDLTHLNTKDSLITYFSPAYNPPVKDLFDLLPKKIANALRYRWYSNSIFSSAQIIFLDFFTIIKQLVSQNQYDIVILEHVSTIALATVIKRFSPTTMLVLDAHNVDHLLLKEELGNSLNKRRLKQIKRIKKIESTLFRRIHAFLACSETDKLILESVNKNRINGIIVPNGVDTKNKAFISTIKSKKNILFCGALNTIANRSGLQWFLNEIWPRLKNRVQGITLTVIGSGLNTKDFQQYFSDNQIIFKGFIMSLTEEYENAYLSIVPLQIGSGTRLKILESMAYGIPVISTTKGAEGVNYPNNTIQIANTAEHFIEKIEFLINDKETYQDQRYSARKFVEQKYSWEAIINKLNIKINDLLEQHKEKNQNCL